MSYTNMSVYTQPLPHTTPQLPTPLRTNWKDHIVTPNPKLLPSSNLYQAPFRVFLWVVLTANFGRELLLPWVYPPPRVQASWEQDCKAGPHTWDWSGSPSSEQTQLSLVFNGRKFPQQSVPSPQAKHPWCPFFVFFGLFCLFWGEVFLWFFLRLKRR